MDTLDYRSGSLQPSVLYNCYDNGDIEGEGFVSDHIFSYIVSGAHDVWIGDRFYSFQAGDYRFFRRNQLTKSVKKTSQSGFKSIAVHLDQNTLKNISKEYGLQAEKAYFGDDILLLKSNYYLDAYINSLSPYINTAGEMQDRIHQLKAKELVLILLETNPALKNVLFDFSMPGKIDLEAFMNRHFRFNVSIDRFAYLTGRSLSGFKRDFEKLFHNAPSRWLVRRRLEEAHFLIEEKGQKPSDVYLGIGFNDLSHFSHAYKKAFGRAPTKNTI
ncbi:MAG: AraC family transcriptional regulator [Mucilaginibacter sp.]|uniref:helix-turn-helix domain-containing protein n=1 Tax=Mucilaginibacter sp. TaxID=1882438 RepID=UPI0031A3CA62